MVGQIYPTELQLNKANSSHTEAPFLDFNLSITNGIVSSKIYDKRDDFNYEIVNFPFLDGDVPRSPSYGVYVSQLTRFMLWLFVRPTGVYLLDFFCSGIQFNLLLSPYPCFISLLYLDLYVLGDNELIS